MRNDKDWFSVKLLHKITISGMPEKDRIDEYYHDIRELFEESIVLVNASSFDEAYQLAESEAKESNDVYKNKYGQTVKQELYDSVDCYHLFGSPKSPVEVYSTFFPKEPNENVESLFNKRYNSCAVEEMHILRHA